MVVPAGVVDGVESAERREELIDQVALDGIDGGLVEGLSTEEVFIAGEDGDGGNQLRMRGPQALDTPAPAKDQRLVPTFSSLVGRTAQVERLPAGRLRR
jgi:hypothetical protein